MGSRRSAGGWAGAAEGGHRKVGDDGCVGEKIRGGEEESVAGTGEGNGGEGEEVRPGADDEDKAEGTGEPAVEHGEVVMEAVVRGREDWRAVIED